MDSVLATSDGQPATGTLFTSRLVRRATPVVRTPERFLRVGRPGRLAGRIGDFGMRLGLSHTSRWALDAQRSPGSTAAAPVRPPLNYWPWRDPDAPAESVEPAEPTPTAPVSTPPNRQRASATRGDQKLEDLRRMLGIGPLSASSDGPSAGTAGSTDDTRAGAAPAPAVRRRVSKPRDRIVHRGLPQTLARRGGTSRGAPGDIAQRMRPQAVDPRTIGTRAAAAPPPPPPPSPARPERGRERSDSSAGRDVERPPIAGEGAIDVGVQRASRNAAAADADPRPRTDAVRGPSEPVVRRPPVPTASAVAERSPSVDRLPHAGRPSAGGDPSGPSPSAVTAPRPPADVVQRQIGNAAGGGVGGGGVGSGGVATAQLPIVAQRAASNATADATSGATSRVAYDLSPRTHHERDEHTSVHLARSLAGDRVPGAVPAGTLTTRRGELPRSAPDSPATIGPQTIQRDSSPTTGPRALRSPVTGEFEAGLGAGRGATIDLGTELGDELGTGVGVDVATRPPTFPSTVRPTDNVSTDVDRSPAGAPSPTARTTAPNSPTPSLTSVRSAPDTVRRSIPDASSGDAGTTTDSRVGIDSGVDARVNSGVPGERRGVQPESPSPRPASHATTPAATVNRAADGRTTTARRPESPTIRPPAAPSAILDPVQPDARLATTPLDARDLRQPSGIEAAERPLRHETERSAPTHAPLIARHSESGSAPVTRPAVTTSPTSSTAPDTEIDTAAATATDTTATASARPPIRRASDIAGDIVVRTRRDTRSQHSPAPPAGRPPVALVPRRASAEPTAPATSRAPDGIVRRSTAERTSPSHQQHRMGRPANALRRSPVVSPRNEPPIDHRADLRVNRDVIRDVDRPTAGAIDRPADRPHRPTDRAAGVPVDVRSLPTAPPLTIAPALSDARTDDLRTDAPRIDDVSKTQAPAIRREAAETSPTRAGTAGRNAANTTVTRADNVGGDRRDVNSIASAPRRTAAEIAAPGNDAAARFRATLQRAPATTSALPSRWRPLATAIVGERPVRLATGPASRAALRAAGKVAATAGNVVHLARPLRGAADAPLLAHELAHVANPSPLPRFFDDHRDSPEERRAELVADVIRRSPVLPRPSAGSMQPGATIRRAPRTAPTLASLATGRGSSPAPAAAPSSTASTTVSASALAAQLTGSASAQIQREMRSGNTSRPIASVNQQAPDVMRALSETSNDNSQSSSSPAVIPNDVRGTWPVLSGQLDSSSLTNFVDWIMEQLEDRIGRELERRGGRYRGEF